MTIIDGQEFCSACNRTLVDFTLMNDEELKEALAKLAGTKSCGAFRDDQVTLSAKQKFVQRLRQVASLTIALFSMKAASAKAGDGVVPASHNEEEAMSSEQDTLSADSKFFKGRLVDNKKFDGVGYQYIYLTNAEGQILQKAETDGDGLFLFDLTQVADSENLRIVTDMYGFKNTSIPVKASKATFNYLVVNEEMDIELNSELELSLMKKMVHREKRLFFPNMRGSNIRRVYGAF